MTNNTEPQTRREALRRNALGSHYANALAFITESVIDGNVEDLTDITMMDYETKMEFAEQYNFTEEALQKAIADMRNTVSFLSAE